MSDTLVQARVQPELKAEAERVFESLGINTAEAIRLFLRQVSLRGSLPFSTESPDNEDLLLPAEMRKAALDSVHNA